MATKESTAAFIAEQLSRLSGVSTRTMFGEYGIWYDGKIVALVCDDQLFVKPTAPGRRLAAGAIEAPPYPGAKPSLLIDAERWDDAEWLAKLIKATADALPAQRPRKR